MNVEKSELKMAMMQDLGKKFEARETMLTSEVYRFEGAITALKQAVEKIGALKGFYEKEVEEDKFEEKDLEVVARAVARCAGVVTSLIDLAQAQKLVKQGEAREAKSTLDVIEKAFNEEKARIANALKALEEGTIAEEEVVRSADGAPTLRVVDGRPVSDAAADLAARRAAARAEKEAKAESTAKVEEKVSEAPTPVEAPEAKTTPAPEPPVPQSSIPPTRRQIVTRRKR